MRNSLIAALIVVLTGCWVVAGGPWEDPASDLPGNSGLGRGLLSSMTRTTFFPADPPTAVSIVTTVYSYNAQGHVRQLTTELDQNVDGTVDSRTVGVYTYNKKGDLIQLVSQVDEDVDGNADRVETWTFTYNAKGQRTSQVRMGYINGDDVLDCMTVTFSYNARGLREQMDQEIDYGCDGILDVVSNMTSSFDSRGNPVEDVSTVYYDDGDPEADSLTVHTYTYNRRGLCESQFYLNDGDNDGTPNSSQTMTYEYNNQGLVVLSVTEGDWDLDGTPNSRTVISTTYDQRGNRIQEISESDNPCDGVVDYVTKIDFTY